MVHEAAFAAGIVLNDRDRAGAAFDEFESPHIDVLTGELVAEKPSDEIVAQLTGESGRAAEACRRDGGVRRVAADLYVERRDVRDASGRRRAMRRNVDVDARVADDDQLCHGGPSRHAKWRLPAKRPTGAPTADLRTRADCGGLARARGVAAGDTIDSLRSFGMGRSFPGAPLRNRFARRIPGNEEYRAMGHQSTDEPPSRIVPESERSISSPIFEIE